MTLFEIFDRLELTYIGTLIRDSVWLFPVIESFHLIGLAILSGAILVTDLRLLGLALNQIAISTTARACQPWLIFGIITMLATGIPLFLSEAIKCFYNPFFWIKMGALLFSFIFTFTVRRKIATQVDENIKSNWTTRSVGTVSMLSWFTVAASGRWIGFY